MTPIYENPAPYILYYALQIPLVIAAIVIMYKNGEFSNKIQKDGGTKILLGLILFVAILFPVGHALWHFVFPTMFPLHETILG